MYEINGHYLCLEHYSMIVQNAQASQQNNMAMMNYLRDSIHETFGLPPSQTRIQIPQPVINSAPVTHNHINVHDSVVGSINTGQVKRIEVAMQHISSGGNEDVSNALKDLTEAIANNVKLEQEARNELIEQLGFLAEQAALPKDQRQSSVISIVLKGIPVAIAGAANLTTIWSQWGPTLTTFFK